MLSQHIHASNAARCIHIRSSKLWLGCPLKVLNNLAVVRLQANQVVIINIQYNVAELQCRHKRALCQRMGYCYWLQQQIVHAIALGGHCACRPGQALHTFPSWEVAQLNQCYSFACHPATGDTPQHKVRA